MPATDQRTLRVRGLTEMQRAFRLADRDLSRDLRATLKDVAEPVRSDAERLAVSGIRNVGLPWSRMRVGVTSKSVYVAPKERGRRSRRRRPNLAGLLMDRAMSPALELNQGRIAHEVEEMLDDLFERWEHA